ncbi:hypothetical protein E2562_022055 [Oryza meyeriana var. granulata]|uniref:Uncharacterized protein n=1 Tax=Oryza meyeriana var. granulata TaxID=110450 RepID=A0A6G1ENN9_9ORYZ|nr:hypothetical protein E2562_022055 [Oryza meyeriana var. granulata]
MDTRTRMVGADDLLGKQKKKATGKADPTRRTRTNGKNPILPRIYKEGGGLTPLPPVAGDEAAESEEREGSRRKKGAFLSLPPRVRESSSGV